MKKFLFALPTKIYFGKGEFKKAGEIINKEVIERDKRIFLITGRNFAQKSGLVDSIKNQLRRIIIAHFNGITPNPKVEEIETAAQIARKEDINLVIALGGGSVMDGTKLAAALAVSGGKLSDYFKAENKFRGSIPVIAIPTIAASGSEADPYAVASDPERMEKKGFYSPFFYPVIAIWDPELTYSLPLSTTADGVVDIISHSLEGYISGEKAALQNGFTEVITREVMNSWEDVRRGKNIEQARERLCWASTLAISPFLSAGRGGHFVLHAIEHAVTGIYDSIPHGRGLAALLIPYLSVVGRKRGDRVSSFTKAIFDIYHWETGLKEFKSWMEREGLYHTLSELGVDDIHLVEEKAWETGKERYISVDMTRDDLREILERSK